MVLEYIGAGDVPSNGPTPGIENWKRYVLGRWPGGMDLGAWGVRNIRGGTTLSVHAVGRAWDWRYERPGPGRASADQAIAFAIDNHLALGIQAVHDYVNCTIWRCNRPGFGPGWKTQQPGDGMGASWARWLHWEVHPGAALHHSNVEQIVGGAPKMVASPESTAALPLPSLSPGDTGPRVKHLQHILDFWSYYDAAIDGIYGPKTTGAVKKWQKNLARYNPGPVDGEFGPKTHAAAAASYAALKAMKGAA